MSLLVTAVLLGGALLYAYDESEDGPMICMVWVVLLVLWIAL